LAANYLTSARHPVDEESGFVLREFAHDVVSEQRWEISCEEGHLLGVMQSEFSRADPIPVEAVEAWLQGRFWSPRMARHAPRFSLKVECGRVAGVKDAFGQPVEARIEEAGPGLWANCERCEELVIADELATKFGLWVCGNCQTGGPK